MINLTHDELAEIKNEALPEHSLENLKLLRNQMCESSQKEAFSLQSQQKFLRLVMSPDSPTRSIMVVHGTGTGKTCTAIQIAEEYILRPEFQDKKVMVVASRAVEDNFRTQLFDMNRVKLDVTSGVLESKQCTGRRYLDMLLRIQSEPKNWNNPEIREKLQNTANKLINEFYEFQAYESFGLTINAKTEKLDEAWIHETFDNRLLIIDEAHNIRASKDATMTKEIARAMEILVKKANGLVLVLLTATPMYDTYEEIVFYMNLFRYNDTDRTKDFPEPLKVGDIFNNEGILKPAKEELFRTWCQTYVSYVKGENPFTFPFRLPPPKVVSDNLATGFTGKPITDNDRIRYLSLVESEATGIQNEVLTRSEQKDDEEKRRALLQLTVTILPGNKTFREVFRQEGDKVAYVNEPFLTPAKLPEHAAKFVSVLKSIENGEGIVLVYSNYVERGANLFAMALEEHGFSHALGKDMLANKAYDGPSKGKYILLTSDASDAEISRMLSMVKSPKNRTGSQVRVIVSSQIVSEGVDFRNVRQIHVLDPWWNMSRIEQVIGRGLRTCSHQSLDFEDQNCTVYLHVIRTKDGRECFDEYTYRTKVEPKAIKIANVRKVIAESAMDCEMQQQINTLPTEWKNLEIPQRRSEGTQPEMFRLGGMMAPMFNNNPDVQQCIVKKSEKDTETPHVRPLSTYLDVRDELLSKLGRLLVDKAIWARDDLLAALRPFTEDVVVYNLQQAITSGFRFKDAFGRPSVLESKDDLYALSPLNAPNDTMVERTTRPVLQTRVGLPAPAETKEEEVPDVEPSLLDEKRTAFPDWPADALTRFSVDILNSYVFDHLLTDAERKAVLRSDIHLPFADRLKIGEILVLGNEKYDPADPVGEDRTRVQEWTTDLVNRFIEDKDKLFASLTEDGKFTMSKTIDEDGSVKRDVDKTQKKFEPIVCGTGKYKKEQVLTFSKFIDERGVGAPETYVQGKKAKKTTVSDICLYTELLAREQHNIVWLTPQELATLFDNPDNKKRFTVAFKK